MSNLRLFPLHWILVSRMMLLISGCFRYMCAHALSLSHPGIRCRCLAAYGDAVSAVKWYLISLSPSFSIIIAY